MLSAGVVLNDFLSPCVKQQNCMHKMSTHCHALTLLASYPDKFGIGIFFT